MQRSWPRFVIVLSPGPPWGLCVPSVAQWELDDTIVGNIVSPNCLPLHPLVRAEFLQFLNGRTFFRTIAESFKSQVDRLSATKISCICYMGKHLKSVKCCTFRMQILFVDVFIFRVLNWHSSIITAHDTFNFYNGKYRLLINWKLCVRCSYLIFIKTL